MTYCQQFIIADSHYKISTDSLRISETLQHLFAGFSRPRPSQSNPITFELVEKSPTTVSISPQLTTASKSTSLDESISLFELNLIQRAFDQMDFIGIHSGAIIYNGKTILFPGPSGKGKTTLTLSSLLRGSAFLSDEMALVQPGTRNVCSFPRVLCVKQDLDIFKPIDTKNKLQHAARAFNNSLCISPSSFNCIPSQTPTPIDAIIFPNFQRNLDTKLVPISPIQSLQKLLKLTYKRTQEPQLLDTLGHIVEAAPSFELTMNNLPEAIERVENFAN